MGVCFRLASKRFWADQAGIITVQMVMLSVLVFGGMGLMMDFGRAYSAHSQMQGYIDQVALAAAQELDGQSDAISRATTAANAVQDGSNFVSGDQDFSIAEIVYMSDAPTDSNGEFNSSLAATYATTQPEKAKYVLAVATTKSVSVRLLNMGSQYGNKINDFSVATAAVATSKRVMCGGMSTLVMCNPFENHATTSWQEQMETSQGYRMRVTADVTDGSKPSNFSGGESRIRLGLLKSPDDLLEVRNIVCSDTSKLPGYATTSLSLETLKDMCMLATVETGMSCVNDKVAFKAAHPTTVTTGLGVVFDMYDGPMADIMDASSDINFAHNLPTSLGYPANINRSDLFHPDLVPALGKMTRADYAIHLDDKQTAVNASSSPFLVKMLANNAINNERSVYGVDASIPAYSRQNYVHDLGMRSEWGPAPIRPCLDQDSGLPACTGLYPSIYDQTPGTNGVDSYVAALYDPYAHQKHMENNPGLYANWWDVPSSMVSSTWIGGNRTTYYDFYSEVERVNAELLPELPTLGHRGRDSSGNPITPPGVGHYGIQNTAVNFTNAYPSAAISAKERRKQRVTVVNCDAAESYASATGMSGTGFSDTYMGEVVDVVDVYMITPPQVKSCSPALTNDPQKNNLCPNDQVDRVDLDLEIVDLASQNTTEFDARFYAVLVH